MYLDGANAYFISTQKDVENTKDEVRPLTFFLLSRAISDDSAATTIQVYCAPSIAEFPLPPSPFVYQGRG